MKFGLALAQARPSGHLPLALAAESAGYESIWMSEHLVLPAEMEGSAYPEGEGPPFKSTAPLFDPFAALAYLAARTERIRLGTNIYLLGLRHPFAAARAVLTLDQLSGGRAEIGVGAGWLREEWTAAGLDPATRGKRLDEALIVCKRLWSEPTVEHRGAFFDFEAVAFEPKPLQRPWPPIHVGGESDAALERAVLHGEGWLGLTHTPTTAAPVIRRLQAVRERFEFEREPFTVTVTAPAPSREDVEAFSELGVDRLIVYPWSRARDAVEGAVEYAESVGLSV